MITFNNMTPIGQATVGLGLAIGYFSSKGYIVSLPTSDNQKYDLIVDIDGQLKKVQVKTSRHQERGKFVVQLKTVCPKKTTKNKITHFDNSQVDYVFILLENCKMYCIPSSEIQTKNSITLTPKHDCFIVTI